MVATSRFGNMKNTRCQLVLAVVEWWLVGNLNTVVSHERRFIKLLQIIKIIAYKLATYITCDAMLRYFTANARVFVIFENKEYAFYSLYGSTSALEQSKDDGPDGSNCPKRQKDTWVK